MIPLSARRPINPLLHLPALCLAALSLAACDDDTLSPPGPAPDVGLALTPVATGFVRPSHIAAADDGSDRLFIVEQAGRVWVIDAGDVRPDPFLDITPLVQSGGSEQGLLSIAFPPGFDRENGHFYVFYTSLSGDGIGDGDVLVSRFRLDDGSFDIDSEQILLRVEQRFANHNGGQLAFGPDGHLHVALGDGGGAGDPDDNGQDLLTLPGSILRIDVETDPFDTDYRIPPDNPFLGNPNARDEILARGLRHPWRFSFDRETGDLYIGDVGQGRFEEINFLPAGAVTGVNFGWDILEGRDCYPEDVIACDRSGLTPPIVVYDHEAGDCAVTGGFVYRGAAWPGLRGTYLHADFCTGTLRGFEVDPDGNVGDGILLETGLAISTFGEDEYGELYIADYATGDIFRIDLQ